MKGEEHVDRALGREGLSLRPGSGEQGGSWQASGGQGAVGAAEGEQALILPVD